MRRSTEAGGDMSSLQFPRVAGAFATACLAMLAGCAQVKLAEPTPSMGNIQLARQVGPVGVGNFSLADGLPKSLDQSVSIRSNTFFSPYDSSWARYLQETLKVELRGAGALDPASRTVISGQLTRSEVEAGSSEGTASLGARFKATRAGKTLYESELVVSDSWPSSFVGAVAIPDAINHYMSLYRQLVAKLLGDENFKAAIKP